jgi:hypothetical protein
MLCYAAVSRVDGLEIQPGTALSRRRNEFATCALISQSLAIPDGVFSCLSLPAFISLPAGTTLHKLLETN